MLLYVLSGAAALLMMKQNTNAAASASASGASVGGVARNVDSSGRPISATGHAVGTPNPQTTARPSSAQSVRADQGNGANQPWYTGALIAGGGLALTGAAKALSGMFSQQANAQGLTGSNSDYQDGQDDDIDAVNEDTSWTDDWGSENAGVDDTSGDEYAYTGVDESENDYSFAGDY